MPSGAVSWGDGDNNTDFLNRNSVLAINPTLSIPASQKSTNPANYHTNIVTIPWPNGPSGRPFPVMTAVKHAVIFKDADAAKLARKFMSSFMGSDNLKAYIEGSQGRWQPVLASLFNVPFWTDPSDKHKRAAHVQYTESETAPFPQIFNYKYTQVQAENLLARTASRIVLDGAKPAEAVAELIQRINKILGPMNVDKPEPVVSAH